MNHHRIRLTRMFLTVALSCCIVCSRAWAGAPSSEIAPRPAPVGLDSAYVPVALDALANDRAGLAATTPHVEVGKVPFELPVGETGGNLFLQHAGWPDWSKDPLAPLAAYDLKPRQPTDAVPVVEIPVADYSAVYLLAATDNDAAMAQVVTLRIGAKEGAARTTYHDYSATVPRFSQAGGPGVVQVLHTPLGNVFLVRVELDAALAQEFRDRRSLDVEITKQLRLSVAAPDAARFQIRPLGPPSGVHLFGMTFMRSALGLNLGSAQAGNIFNQPQVPTFRIDLTALGVVPGRVCHIDAVATDYYGGGTDAQTDVKFGTSVTMRRIELPIPVPRLGYHSLVVTLSAGGDVLLRKTTSFALLPPDTRRHRDQSPFGTWDFSGGHYTSANADEVGPLYVKAGLRYGMFDFSQSERQKYGVLNGQDRDTSDVTLRQAIADKADPAGPPSPPRWLIFHEDAISGDDLMRIPDAISGRHYQLNADEQKKFAKLWDLAQQYTQPIRKEFPEAKIYLGNGNLQLLEELLRHKFPANLFDVAGNEAASFMRLPETQPTDCVANNSSLWMDRKILDFYGYHDKTVGQCYEMGYPSTNPGNLSLQTQANYLVRNIMHSLAWKVPVIRPSCITDVGNSYYFSNWGASGLCFAQPDIAPKPSYVAYANLTLLLDGASFTRQIPTGTPTIYAFEFKRPDGGFVSCLWTPRGSRVCTLSLANGSDAHSVDLMGNQNPLEFGNGQSALKVSEEPVYVVSSSPLTGITAAAPENSGSVADKRFLISALDQIGDWNVEQQPNHELETYDFYTPRRQGKFDFGVTRDPQGTANVTSVQVRRLVPGSVYLPMYSVLARNNGVPIPDQPTAIGLMVYGNGGWGRIIWELSDASGQRWILIGAEQAGAPNPWLADSLSPAEFAKLKTSGICDWNSDDAWGRSYINFESWRYLQFPLPGNYPGEGYHWPANSQWRCVASNGDAGDGIVHYPLTFTKLIVTMPEKLLYGTQEIDAPRTPIYLKNLQASYASPEDAWNTR